MAAIVRPKIASMRLVIASPALAIVGHVYRIAVGIRRCDPERERQGAPDLLGLATGDTEQLPLGDKLLVGIIQNDVEAIIFQVETGPLVLLVLGDVHATPAWIETIAVLVRDIFRTNALDGFRVRRDHLGSTNIILRPPVIHAAFVDEYTACERDGNRDSVC